MQAGASGRGLFWGPLTAMLANTSHYYEQFAPAVREALDTQMAPFEKQLEVRCRRTPRCHIFCPHRYVFSVSDRLHFLRIC